MFVGHGLLAFALVALVGRYREWPRERTLQFAVLAAAFATLPDVDVLYAPFAILVSATGSLDVATFWASANVVHRTVTHSLVVAAVGALGFGLVALAGRDGDRRRLIWSAAGIAILTGLAAVGTVQSGLLGGAVLLVFCAFGVAVVAVATRRGVSPRPLAGLALLGLATHPFGDLFTGEPPVLLYPFDLSLVSSRLVLHPDPTIHLLGAFAIELGTVWLAAHAGARLFDLRLRDHLHPRATLGAAYALAILVIPAPTLGMSYQFVFSVLAVSVVGSVRFPIRLRRRLDRAVVDESAPTDRRLRLPTLADAPGAIVTGLAAVTLAALAYTGAYLLL